MYVYNIHDTSVRFGCQKVSSRFTEPFKWHSKNFLIILIAALGTPHCGQEEEFKKRESTKRERFLSKNKRKPIFLECLITRKYVHYLKKINLQVFQCKLKLRVSSWRYVDIYTTMSASFYYFKEAGKDMFPARSNWGNYTEKISNGCFRRNTMFV